MPEEIKTAETKEVKGAGLDESKVEDTLEVDDTVNEAEFKETEGDGEETKKEEPKKEEPKKDKPKQSPEENAKFARERREAERKAEIEKARIDAIITAVGENPYTGEPLKTKDDVEIYLTMKEIEKNGGDPLNSQDYLKHLKIKQQAEAEKRAAEKQKEEWLQKDIMDFKTKHPDLKLDELFNDKNFRIFAKGKAGNIPMAEIYSDYTAMLSEFEEKSKTKAARIIANKAATPGSLKGEAADGGDGLYTEQELANMSRAQLLKNWEKVEKSYAAFQKRK